MLEKFFTTISAPDFVKPVFEQEDWYRAAVAGFKDMISKQYQQSDMQSTNPTLRTTGIVVIGKDCLIGDYVVIEGPAYIGNGVEIGPGAFIRAGSIICDGCMVGHAAETKNVLMMDGSKTANHTFVGDGILGTKARVGGHCESANRRFDQQNVLVSFEDQKLETGLDKYGMILGEEARLGGSVMTLPGTAIGRKSFISTGVVIGGYVPPEKFVKAKIELEIVDNGFKGSLHNDSKLYENQ